MYFQMELFNEDVDGRTFNSQDIVLFKKDSPITTPITVIKNFSLTGTLNEIFYLLNTDLCLLSNEE